MNIADLRNRIERELEAAKRESGDRRRMIDDTQAAYASVLRDVAAPLFRQAVAVLRADNHGVSAHTPHDSVRLVSERSGEDFIEIELDTRGRVPHLVGRTSVTRGKGVEVEEQPIAPDKPLAEIGDEDVVAFLVPAIRKLLVR